MPFKADSQTGPASDATNSRFNITSQLDEIMKFLKPGDAEHAFYEAFETGDIDAMMSVWARDEDIVCVHPQGARLVGRTAVETGWREVLQSSIGVRFQITELRAFTDQALAVHMLYENLWVPGENAPRAPIFATNAYRYSKRGWHLVLHHASPVQYDEQQQSRSAIFH